MEDPKLKTVLFDEEKVLMIIEPDKLQNSRVYLLIITLVIGVISIGAAFEMQLDLIMPIDTWFIWFHNLIVVWLSISWILLYWIMTLCKLTIDRKYYAVVTDQRILVTNHTELSGYAWLWLEDLIAIHTWNSIIDSKFDHLYVTFKKTLRRSLSSGFYPHRYWYAPYWLIELNYLTNAKAVEQLIRQAASTYQSHNK